MSRLLPAVLVVGLLGGSAAAFAVTERLKLERSPIFGTLVDKFVSPASGRRAKIVFRLRKSDRLSLAIVDSQDRVVRALIDSRDVPAGRKTYTWDGRNDAGEIVPNGPYKPRVHLAGQHRTIVLPNPIAVDTKPPLISLTGMPTKPGLYRLRLGAIDQAGNLGPQTRAFTVRVRYVELGRRVIRARAGGLISVRVTTDSHFYYWRIGVRHGRVRSRRLVLAAGAPGRYRLVVSERGHRAAALVVVSP
ncbi:MAG: hypothetical protein E6G25_05175 [Actinobacteria bacterium]|nr:MAG: hypothetical protein E6G25_05175 [Actinomycetota bacterium]